MQNAIECEGVGKRYPHFSLNDIDLRVETGSVMGFVGPNGAGKSTTLRIMLGLVHQDHGRVTVLGKSMPAQQIEAKWDIGYYSEDMRLYPSQSIDFHLRLMASIYPRWDADYAARLLDHFGLASGQKVKGLSHGQRVKANLLLVLARRPQLLVLDEPTTGLDPLARKQILEEMSAALSDETRTILFSSHNTLDVEQISDQITFINDGSIVFSEDKEQLLDSWRRIRLEIPADFQLPKLPGVVAVEQSGHLAVITTQSYCEGMHGALASRGASVSAVERMTLEEIFLTGVSDAAQSDSADQEASA